MPEKPFGLAVRAILLDRQGRCLLLRRSNVCNSFVGTWEWPGGKVDVGESADVALRREVAEETGLKIELTGVAGAYPLEIAGRQIAVLCLEARTIGEEEVHLSEEHSDFAWAPLGELTQWELAPALRDFAARYVTSNTLPRETD